MAEKESRKLVNFRLPPEEAEGLRILAEITDMSQVDVIRCILRMEILKQKDAIEAYKKKMAEVKDMIKK